MSVIDFKDLIILINIHKNRSISETSRKLFLSQPAITYRLRNLEKELGIKILNRHSDGVSFTDQGMYLLEYSKKTIQDYENLKSSIKKINNDISGKINIYVSTVFAKYYLASILKNFNKEFPDIDVNLNTYSSCELDSELIREHKADIIIRRGDMEYDGSKVILAEEPYGIVSKTPINLSQLKSKTFINYDTSVESNEIFWNWCETVLKNKHFEKIIQVNSIEASLDLVSQDLGWTMLPKIHLSNFKNLFFYPITDEAKKVVKRQNILLYDTNSENLATKIFVDFVTQCMSNMPQHYAE